MGPIRRRGWSLYLPSPSLHALAATLVVGVLLGPLTVGSAAVAEPAPVVKREFEVLSLRTETSETFVQPDGSMKTVLHAQPVHFRDTAGVWRKIRRQFVQSERPGYRWRNDAAGFKAELRGSVAGDFLRFEAKEAGLTLSLLDAVAESAEARGPQGVRYTGVRPGVDLEYELLPNGLKETLVLRDAKAPSVFEFRIAPLPGDALSFRRRGDGSFEILDGVSATAAAVLNAPIVSDSRSVTVEGPAGPRQVLIDSPAAAGMVTASIREAAGGAHVLTLAIDERWLRDPERVFPVKLDPTVTTAVDLQDGFFNVNCSGPCPPNMTSAAMSVGYDGSGANYVPAMIFSLADIPQGAQVTSAQATVFLEACIPPWTGMYPTYGCPFFWPGTGGYSTTVQLRPVTTAWGPSTSAQSFGYGSTSLGEFGGQWYWSTGSRVQSPQTFAGSALNSHIQSIVDGASNHGLALVKTAGDTTGLEVASSRSSDPNRAPRLEVQWVADAVQLHESTNVRSDGPELTWTRFSPGLGPYALSVLDDAPRAYARRRRG